MEGMEAGYGVARKSAGMVCFSGGVCGLGPRYIQLTLLALPSVFSKLLLSPSISLDIDKYQSEWAWSNSHSSLINHTSSMVINGLKPALPCSDLLRIIPI